jgi:GT2 family glycosyltransferase
VPNRRPTLSVLIVTWNEREQIALALTPLMEQLEEGDEVIVADNASTDGTVHEIKRVAPGARVIEMPSNRGYTVAANAAAAVSSGDLLITLDADAAVAPGFCDAIRAPAEDGRGWEAWMGLLTMDGGRLINTSGGVCHFTGISWTSQIGLPVSVAPTEPHEVGFLTGACLTTTRAAWERSGGFPEEYFLYFDDVDYSWRTRLAGGKIGIEPSAVVDHIYDFHRVQQRKWRYLERNRWATIIRTYPSELLLVLAPALIATELALIGISLHGGWGREKLRAIADVVRWLPRLLRERREIQATRCISARAFSEQFTADLSSPYLGRAAHSTALRIVLRAYWRAVRAVLPR